jgi:type II secretory pathway pseudopilin PulG
MVEILVVMALIVALAVLLVAISPRFVEDQRVSRGADQLQGWILVAKSQAFRDNAPRGIRLVRDPNNPNTVRGFIYIERPEDLAGLPDPTGNKAQDHNHIQVPAPSLLPAVAGAPPESYVFLPKWDVTSMVRSGDWFKLVFDAPPYNLHRISDVTYDAVNGGTVLRLAAADGSPSPMTLSPIAPVSDTPFLIMRQPQPLTGEMPLSLPRDVIVDLDPKTVGTSVLPGAGAPDELDIMFDNRGAVTGSNASGGKVILRVRAADRPTDYGVQLFVVIFIKTGLISAHPVNLDPADPYKFTRDGKDSGM